MTGTMRPARFSGGRMLILFSLSLVGAVAGCGLDDSLNRIDQATYRRDCSGFGFTPGTTAFAQCMQQPAAQRANENHQIMNRAHLDEAADRLGKNK